jgi:tRNA ligase
MAIVVRLVDEENRWTCVNRVAHITVGTASASVKPKESNDLLEKWLEEGADGEKVLEIVLESKPRLSGTVRGVCSARPR